MSTRISTYSQIYGTTLKQPCIAATTGDISLSGLTTVDGISLSSFDRVLVWQQTLGEENGIYIVTGGTWYRATDMSASQDMFTGVEVYVNSGNTYSQKTFTLTTNNPISAGTTPLTFELTSNVNYVQNYGVGRVLISDGSVEGIVAQSGLTYDFDAQIFSISGDTKINGDLLIESASASSLTTGTHILESIPCISGSSANFEYFVKGSSNQIRSGNVMTAWNCTGATYTEVSTPDLNGSTEDISFSVDTNSNNIRLNAIITSGSWEVKVGTRIIF